MHQTLIDRILILLLYFEPLKLLKFDSDMDSDPAFHSNTEPDPDPASKNNEDPDPNPQPWYEDNINTFTFVDLCSKAEMYYTILHKQFSYQGTP